MFLRDPKNPHFPTPLIFQMNIPRERLFKVLLIGDPSVGKTSFVNRYTNDEFRTDYKGTVGVDFALKVVHLTNDIVIKLQLWDIAGQDNCSILHTYRHFGPPLRRGFLHKSFKRLSRIFL